MVQKLFFNIYIPALGKNQSFLIPSSMQIQEAIAMLCQLLREEYPGVCAKDEHMVLWSEELGGVLDKQKTIEEQNIRDGMEFILF